MNKMHTLLRLNLLALLMNFFSLQFSLSLSLSRHSRFSFDRLELPPYCTKTWRLSGYTDENGRDDFEKYVGYRTVYFRIHIIHRL